MIKNQDELENKTAKFDGAVMLLPYKLREAARSLTKMERARCEELRCRIGKPMSALMPEGEFFFKSPPVTRGDLNGILDIVTQASAHTVNDSMKNGYITVKGGYRIGLCGTGIINGGEMCGFKIISSVSVRIPKQIKNIASEIIPKLMENGEFPSTLVISPPGGGKTTLLRDMILTLSNGEPIKRIKPMRIGVSDERCEISGMWDGVPQMELGDRTDILDNCPKDIGIMMLLKTMNPQVIAADEITAQKDIDAIIKAAGCGVKMLATAHASSVQELMKRPLYRELSKTGIFSKVVIIRNTAGGRVYDVQDFPVL